MIFQALKHGEELEREKLHCSEMPTAQLSAIYVNAHQTKPPYKNAADFCFFKPPDKRFSEILANTFVELIEEALVPAWVAAIAPIEEIEKATQGIEISKPRAWIAPGIFIVCPKSIEGGIEAALIVLDYGFECDRDIKVFDVDDTQISHRISVPLDAQKLSFNTFWATEE